RTELRVLARAEVVAEAEVDLHAPDAARAHEVERAAEPRAGERGEGVRAETEAGAEESGGAAGRSERRIARLAPRRELRAEQARLDPEILAHPELERGGGDGAESDLVRLPGGDEVGAGDLEVGAQGELVRRGVRGARGEGGDGHGG